MVGWAAGLTIGVVDMGRAIKAHPDTQQADALLQKQVEEFELEQKEMLEERERLKSDLEAADKEARSRALSDREREKKVDIVEDKLRDLRSYEAKIRRTAEMRRKQLTDQEGRMRKRIEDKLREVVETVAGEQELDLVLDTAARGTTGIRTIVYNSEAIDITDDILKAMEKESGKTDG
jgi:Skp family chaperone for outer membrane proteins